MMKQCPQCGSRYGDDHKFCSACGSLLEPVPEETPAPEAEVVPAQPEEAAPVTEIPAAEPAAEPAEEPAPQPEETPVTEPEPAAEPEEEKKPKREKPKVGVGRRILAVLLSLLLFVFLLAPALGYSARRATTEEGIRAILEDVSLAGLHAAPFFDDVDDEDLTLSELLSEDLNRIGLKIGESSVAKILNSGAMKTYLASQTAPVFADIYSGRTRFEFDPQSLRDELLSGGTSFVLLKEKVELSAAEAADVTRLLTGYGLADALSRDAVKENYPGVNRAMNLCLSYITIIALLVAALVLIVLIFSVNRRRFAFCCGDVGGAAIGAGAVLTLAAVLARLLPRVWRAIVGGSELLAEASAGVLFYNIRIGLILLGAGLVLAILGRLLRGKKAE